MRFHLYSPEGGSGLCRWDRIQRLKDEKGHELLSTADVQSFLQSCQETKAQLRCQLSGIDTVDAGCSAFTLQAEDRNQSQTFRDIQTLEAKIAYLKSVAKMYGALIRTAKRREKLMQRFINNSSHAAQNMKIIKIMADVSRSGCTTITIITELLGLRDNFF